jgi:hypothetical protein
MKKMWFAFGILLILVGCIVGVYGTPSEEKEGTLLESKESPINAWSVSFYYHAGQWLELGIAQGENWVYLPFDTTDEFKVGGEYIEFCPVTVTITGPTGHNATLEAEYRPVEKQTVTTVNIFIVKVLQKSAELKLQSSNDTWTSGNDTYTSEYLYQPKIYGLTQLDGSYTVTVSRLGLPSPPSKLILYKYELEIDRDQWFLIPIGGIVAISGGGVSVWSAKSGTRKRSIKLKK